METPVYKITSGGSPGSVYIGNFHRDGSIGPDAFAQLAWLPGTGLQIKMWSYDRFPISNCTDPNGPINKDSYLACYIDFFPRFRTKGYISVEMNANGICRCTFGPNGYDRETFEEMDLPQLEVEITHPTRDGGRCWMAQTLIPAQTIQAIYNLSSQLHVGHQMRANFFTACESTHAPYWGSWKPISNPNFHLHEYFGLLEIA